jgi:heat shock protein HslJ
MNMKKIMYTVVITGLMFLISCSSSKVQNDVSKLTSNKWELVSITGKTFDANAAKSGIPFMLFSQNNGFTGNTGCNAFTGSYKFENDKLSLDPGAMTKMYCDDSPETDFLFALRKATGYKIKGTELVLLNGTTELMKFISKN